MVSRKTIFRVIVICTLLLASFGVWNYVEENRYEQCINEKSELSNKGRNLFAEGINYLLQTISLEQDATQLILECNREGIKLSECNSVKREAEAKEQRNEYNEKESEANRYTSEANNKKCELKSDLRYFAIMILPLIISLLTLWLSEAKEDVRSKKTRRRHVRIS